MGSDSFPKSEVCANACVDAKTWPEAIVIRGETPSDILSLFASRGAFIYFLEAWAQIIPALACLHLLGDRYIAFCDNEAAKHALIKGYGNDIPCNNLLGTYWAAHAISGTSPWMERVTTHANIADAVSRNDVSFAQSQGWLIAQLDLSKAYSILRRIATDSEFAHAEAHSLMIQDLRPQIDKQICGWNHK